jgi:hypothetical protein
MYAPTAKVHFTDKILFSEVRLKVGIAAYNLQSNNKYSGRDSK